jgi:hypothetical protein
VRRCSQPLAVQQVVSRLSRSVKGTVPLWKIRGEERINICGRKITKRWREQVVAWSLLDTLAFDFPGSCNVLMSEASPSPDNKRYAVFGRSVNTCPETKISAHKRFRCCFLVTKRAGRCLQERDLLSWRGRELNARGECFILNG